MTTGKRVYDIVQSLVHPVSPSGGMTVGSAVVPLIPAWPVSMVLHLITTEPGDDYTTSYLATDSRHTPEAILVIWN